MNLPAWSAAFALQAVAVESITAEVLTDCPIGLVGQSETAYGVNSRPQTSHVLR